MVWRQKYYTNGPGKAPRLDTIARELGTLKQIFVFVQKEGWSQIEEDGEYAKHAQQSETQSRVDVNKELAKDLVDEMERRKKLGKN